MSRRSNVGCLDACCWPGRSADDFDLESGKALSDVDVAELLKMSASGVTFLVLVQLFIKLLWELTTIVPGFALYDGSPSTLSAYTHAGWWMVIDTLTLAFGLSATYFGLNYASEEGVLERGVERTHEWLGAYVVMLIFASIADLVHAAFSLSELGACESSLCRGNQWNLIVLVVVLFLRAVLLQWCAFRAWVFKCNLKLALAYGRTDMSLGPSEQKPEWNPERAKTRQFAPAATPLLRSARSERRVKKLPQ